MRALALVLVVACTPDIAPGAYLCGPEQECPDGLACSGSDFSCEDSVTATTFSCTAGSNTTVATATALPALACVSSVITSTSCLAAGEGNAWFQFATPADCAAVGVTAMVTFPYAFESVGIVLADANGATVANDGPCATPANGESSSCLAMTLTDGSNYTIDVVPEGGGDCDGSCNYNQYTLSVQLVTPH